MRICHLTRLDDLWLGDVIVAVANVLLDGGLEEHRLLADDADVLTQPLDVVVANVLAVDLHLTGDDVIEALQQLHRGALAAAARSHQRHRLADVHFQVQTLQHLQQSTLLGKYSRVF